MKSVTWKRKRPACVSSSSASVFLNQDDSEEESTREFVDDWKLLIPSNKRVMLEDSITKSKRLVQEATVLAEETRLIINM